MDETIQLLKQLTESYGISGYESPIRNRIKSYLQPLGPIIKNKLGNLRCLKEGKLRL